MTRQLVYVHKPTSFRPTKEKAALNVEIRTLNSLRVNKETSIDPRIVFYNVNFVVELEFRISLI